MRVYARYAILNEPDPEPAPIPIEVWEPDPENPGYLQYAGNRPVGDVLKELKRRLEAEGLLADLEGISQVYRMFEPQAEFPRYWRLACYAVTGASEGHYVHVDALVPREDAKPPYVEAVPVFLGKTFRGMDFAYRVAAACARHLGA